jgi:hypothetical protein
MPHYFCGCLETNWSKEISLVHDVRRTQKSRMESCFMSGLDYEWRDSSICSSNLFSVGLKPLMSFLSFIH